jgi:phospholipid/cholesterol/gamma-HCH transport system substrate-binding protein
MRFSIRFADKIVGTLVLLALVLLIFVILMLGKNQRWFAHDSQYKTYFTSASGLSPNMAVQYKGFTIGHVKSFRLSYDNSVEVFFTIFEEYKDRVKENSVVEIIISPIGLGNTFVFYPGKGTNIIPEGDTIPEINSLEGRRLVLAGLVERPESAGDVITSIMNQVRSILTEINIVVSSVKGSEDTSIGRILKNLEMSTEALALQLSPIMDNLEAVTDQMSSPSGTVMSLLDSRGPIYTDITSALNSLADIIENLNNISEFVPNQLPQVAILINDLSVAMRSAQDVLTAVSNNPLLRGGITKRGETDPGGTNLRNLDF